MKYLKILARAVTEQEQHAEERGLDRKQVEDVKIKKILNHWYLTVIQWCSYIFQITLKELRFPKDWPHFASTEVTRVFAIGFSRGRLTTTLCYMTSAHLQRWQCVFGFDTSKRYHLYACHLSTAPLPLFQLQTTQIPPEYLHMHQVSCKMSSDTNPRRLQGVFLAEQGRTAPEERPVAVVTYQPGNIEEFLGKMK